MTARRSETTVFPVTFFLPGLGGPTESRRKKVPEIQQLIQGVFKGAGEIVEHAHKLFVFPLGDAAAQQMTAAWGGGFCAGSQGYGDGAAADIHSASVIALCFQCIQKCFCHFLGEKRDRTFQRQFLRTGKGSHTKTGEPPVPLGGSEKCFPVFT